MQHRRVVVSRYGGPEVLQIVIEDLPEPGPGEVRVKVLAAGVAWGDSLERQGFGAPRPPFTPGYDVVGIAEKLGDGVTTIRAGQSVAALPILGGYAEYVNLPESSLVAVPEGIDPAEAVSLVMNYVVAYQMLHRAAQVGSGDRILVHSAAGGVGTALLQLGSLVGLEMYGTASSHKQETVACLGGIPIDHRRGDFVRSITALTGSGVDAAFDPFGGPHLWRSYQTLRKSGRLVVYGAHRAMTGRQLRLVFGLMLGSILNQVPDGKVVMFYNLTRPKYSSPAWCLADLRILLDLLEQAKIKPIIAARIPLVEAAYAHELLGGSTVVGKIVLTCSPYGGNN